MTAVSPTPPRWLVDAVLGLVASAYEAGRADASASATPPSPATPDSYTLKEAATSLRVSMTTLNRLVTTEELPSFYVGARRFVRPADLEEFRARAKR